MVFNDWASGDFNKMFGDVIGTSIGVDLDSSGYGIYSFENTAANAEKALLEDITLSWNFLNEYDENDQDVETFFELDDLQIFYTFGSSASIYLLSGNFKKGMEDAVYRMPWRTNQIFSTFNYNSSPLESFFLQFFIKNKTSKGDL